MQKQPNPQFNSNNANLAHYKWNAIFSSHSKMLQFVHTPDKKTYSEAFNVSKRVGRNLWELLAPVLPDSKNKELSHSLEIALYQWMLTNPLKNTFPVNNVPFITGLQFNQEQTLAKTMNITVTANRNNNNAIELVIPALTPINNISAPAKTESLVLKIMATAYSIADGSETSGYLTELTIPYNDIEQPLQNIILPVIPKTGVLITVAMSVEYNIGKENDLQMVHNLLWMPSGIIWSGYN
jgi:hypothetical protein